MKKLLFGCLVISLFLSCEKGHVIEGLSVNANIINMGNVVACAGRHIQRDNLVVQVSVKNNSKRIESFWIMRCSWEESFRTDRDDITFCGRNCSSNYPILIKLEHNQSMVFNCLLEHEYLEVKPDTFKIGLMILDKEDFIDCNKKLNRKYKESKKTYWSNSLSLNDKTFGYNMEN